MNQDELEIKWREEFESMPIESHHRNGQRFSKFSNGQYDHTHVDAQWTGYFQACKARQKEIEKRDELLEDINTQVQHVVNFCGFLPMSIKTRFLNWLKKYGELKNESR